MESEFVKALLSPPQPVIIGVRMRPFTLGHSALLHQIDSAFVNGTFPHFAELLAAALICAHTWEENRRMGRIRRLLTMWVWGRLAGKFDVPNATIAMFQHIRSGDEYPETEPPEKPEAVRELAAPPVTRIYTFLRASGFSESEAWNMPLNAANWMHASVMEEEGKITLLSSRRRAFLEMARRERELAAKEAAAA